MLQSGEAAVSTARVMESYQESVGQKFLLASERNRVPSKGLSVSGCDGSPCYLCLWAAFQALGKVRSARDIMTTANYKSMRRLS